MSKLKNAELEERALEVADKILTRIENEIDTISIKDLKALIDAYNTLKPYF